MLYYEKKGKGPAVVLLHGLPSNHTIWEALTNSLAEGFSFILPDFPGAGGSQEAIDGFQLTDVAKEIGTILDKEGIKEAVIAGHSMGGYTAIAFARLFPERTKAVSFIHSSASADTEDKRKMRQKSIKLIEKGQSQKRIFVKMLMKSLFAPEFVQNQPEIVQKAIENGNKISAKSLVDFYKALMNREDNISLLSSAPFPFQWIFGTEDIATNLEDTLPLTLKARINDVCVYPSCGHMSMLENPERLKADLNRFWRYVYGLS